jgi:membrane-associated phospholipid phosphatase
MDLERRLDPDTRLGLRFTLALAAFVLVVVPFGFLLVEVLSKGPVTRLDERIARRMNSYALRDPGAVRVAKWVTDMGSTLTLVVVVVAVAAYFLLRRRQRRPPIFLVVTAICGTALNNLLKIVVGRARPHFDRAVSSGLGKSFPSGHAMNSAVVYGSVLVLVWLRFRSRRIRATAAVVVVLLVSAIAASRVVLGVHYLSDVVAGVTLGTAFVLTSAASFRIWHSHTR